jgi:hypothetical protein
MSGRLVSTVLESALPAWLKPYAVAFASFAADDGSRIYPTIARIARMVSRSERMTQYAVAELRRLHVLEVVKAGGRNTATRYQLHAERLPVGGDGEQIDLFTNVSRFPQGDRRNSGVIQGFPQVPQALTRNPLHPRGATGCTRSVSRSEVLHVHARARENRKRKAI